MTVLPGILICLLVFIGMGNGQSQPMMEGPKGAVLLNTETFDDHPSLEVENIPIDERLDYHAIRQFISQRYTKVTPDDAELISRSLVQYGKENQVDPKLIAALMARESAFNRDAISVTGAKGLGQIKDFNFDSLAITDPFDITQNTRGTVTYMKRMLKRWQSDSKKVSLALASYFKGHNAVARSEKRVDPVTKQYVQDILSHYKKLQELRNLYVVR